MANNNLPQYTPNAQKNKSIFVLLHWLKTVIHDARRLERIGVK